MAGVGRGEPGAQDLTWVTMSDKVRVRQPLVRLALAERSEKG
jgi:hypothetical protein